MEFCLHEFIPSYPDQDDEYIQEKISRKKEFLEKAALIKEPAPKRGEYYSHQEFFLRFGIPYDYCLIMDETGTGKSCKMVSLIRYYRKHKSNYKKCYIIEKGKSTIEEMKNQIVYKCSKENEFETEIIKESSTSRARKKNITSEIKKWINLETYWSFISPIYEQNMSDEDIADHYSDSQFYLDEVHNLNETDDDDNKKVDKYKAIWKIFHLAKRSKFFIFTATPAVNDVKEFASIMNLLLPANFQMPLNWDYTKVTVEQMEPFFRGRVTFVKSLDTGAVPEYQGERVNKTYELLIPDEKWQAPVYFDGQEQPQPPMKKIKVKSELVVYSTEMQGLQKKVYGDELVNETDDKKNKTFWFGPRQISISVFPDGSFGGTFPRIGGNDNSGLGKYIKSSARDDYTSKPEIEKIFRDHKKFKNISSKISEIVDIEISEEGCGYIYCDFVAGGGAIFISEAFHANGFEKFSMSNSVFIIDKGKKIIDPQFTKRQRYVLLTHDSTESARSSIMELWNSDENVNGEYIKEFITSPTGKEGINLNHVLRCHIVNASWNYASTYQAISRIFRATSYVKYIEVKKKSENVKIKIYKHVSMYEDQSIDLKIYEDAEIKNFYIQRLMNMAEQCSVDAILNFTRNNYRHGNHPIPYLGNKLPEDDEIDYSTYDILYNDKEIDSLINKIIDYLMEKSAISFNEIIEYWGNIYRLKIIYMTIEKIFYEKRSIKNKFGYNCFININNNVIFLQKNYPNGENGVLFSMNNLFICENKQFKDLVKINQEPKQSEKLQDLENIENLDSDISHKYFNVLLSQLNIENKVELLENAIFDKIQNKNNRKDDLILNIYSLYFMKLLEPWRDIKKITELNKSKYVMNKMLEEIITEDEDITDEFGNKNKVVFVHFLYSLIESGDYGYNKSLNFNNANGKIRILILNSDKTGTWRNATKYEEPIYRFYLQKNNESHYEDIKKHDVYGMLFNGEKFSLYDKTLEHTNIKNQDNSSLKTKGRECKTWEKNKLINILIREDLVPEELDNIDVSDLDDETMIEYLLMKKYSKNYEELKGMERWKLELVYKWYYSRISSGDICNLLKQYLDENGRLLVV